MGRGCFLTKSSEIRPRVVLVLADGSPFHADVAAREPSLDLALLRLHNVSWADGIPPVQWAKEKNLKAGTVLAAVTPREFTPITGVVSLSARAVPAIPGILPVQVKDAKDGPTVTMTFAKTTTPWLRSPDFPIQVGDVVTHVAGQAIQTREEFVKHHFGEGGEIGRHPRVAGELVEVTWIRDKKKMTAWVNLRNVQSSGSQRVRPHSYRYTGFKSAIAVDFGARPEHCGVPVVDTNNRVEGLLIARAPFIESLVLPGSDAQDAVDRMLKSIEKK